MRRDSGFAHPHPLPICFRASPDFRHPHTFPSPPSQYARHLSRSLSRALSISLSIFTSPSLVLSLSLSLFHSGLLDIQVNQLIPIASGQSQKHEQEVQLQSTDRVSRKLESSKNSKLFISKASNSLTLDHPRSQLGSCVCWKADWQRSLLCSSNKSSNIIACAWLLKNAYMCSSCAQTSRRWPFLRATSVAWTRAGLKARR